MSDELRKAADAGDSEAMYTLATELEARARAMIAEAQEWLEKASVTGSLDALHGLVRIAVGASDYEGAVRWLEDIPYLFPDAAGRSWVSIAPDVLGRDLPLDGEGTSGLLGIGTFTVITAYGARAAAALEPVAPRLIEVNEFGELQPWDPNREPYTEVPYTPSYVAPLEYNQFAVEINVDTDGDITAAMGRTMVTILADALAANRIPSHIAGFRRDLQGQLRTYEPPA